MVSSSAASHGYIYTKKYQQAFLGYSGVIYILLMGLNGLMFSETKFQVWLCFVLFFFIYFEGVQVLEPIV